MGLEPAIFGVTVENHAALKRLWKIQSKRGMYRVQKSVRLFIPVSISMCVTRVPRAAIVVTQPYLLWS